MIEYSIVNYGLAGSVYFALENDRKEKGSPA
jgi:hypothetical protein